MQLETSPNASLASAKRATHDSQDLITLFDGLFVDSEGTRLVRGGAEPLYLPRSPERPVAEVIFAHGFFASVLHEVAHWCLVGPERRRLQDYGFWYRPAGRTAEQQREFEVVEARPQALEWIFSVAAGSVFHLSADNIGGDPDTVESEQRFRQRVVEEARALLARGLPPRALRFATALSERYGTGDCWRREDQYV
jgi:elongation factor P hydroxylase